MRYLAYERVSTNIQAEKGSSVQTQKEAIEIYCRQQEAEIYQHYTDDGYSGSNLDRPAFKELLAELKEGDIILVYNLDRLSRDLFSFGDIIKELEVKKATLIDVLMPFSILTPEGELPTLMKILFAHHERKMILKRTREGLKARAKKGLYTSSQEPYGYKYKKEIGKLEINPKEAKIVKWIFSQITENKLSSPKIAVALNEKGIPPKKPNDKKRKYIGWGPGSVYQITKNSIYYGEAYYNKRQTVKPERPRVNQENRKKKKTSCIKRPREDWIKIEVPAIINRETFDKTQEVLKSNFLPWIRTKKYKYLLNGGVMKCASCGSGFQTATDWRLCNENRQYSKYRCRGRILKLLKKNCKMPYIKSEKIESFVWDKIKEAIKTPSIIIGWASYSSQENNISSLEAEFNEFEKMITNTLKEEERVKEAYRLGIYSIRELEEERVKIKKKIIEVGQKKNQLAKEISTRNLLKNNIETFEERCRKFAGVIDNFTFEEKKEMIRLLNIKVFIDLDFSVKISGVIPIPEKQDDSNQIPYLQNPYLGL